MVAQISTRKFTVDEFHRMVEVGILNEDDRLELLDGQIIEIPPIGHPHQLTVDRLTRLLVLALQGQQVLVHTQNSVRLTHETELYPDISIVADRGDEYWDRGPRAEDVLLVIEVSDATLAFDRRTKGQRYARAGIQELWIFNVRASELEVYRVPSDTGYADKTTLQRSDQVSPLAFPDLQIPLEQLLR